MHELVSFGFEVRLARPVQARALPGRRRSAKTARLDARWLARLLAKEMLPESWIPPEIQRLRRGPAPFARPQALECTEAYYYLAICPGRTRSCEK